jgi:hypothetical protein
VLTVVAMMREGSRPFGFGLSGQAEAKFRKSFLLLFFKKEGLTLP